MAEKVYVPNVYVPFLAPKCFRGFEVVLRKVLGRVLGKVWEGARDLSLVLGEGDEHLPEHPPKHLPKHPPEHPPEHPNSQARKRHININLLVRLLLGHPGNVPGTNRECPRDKVGLSQGQSRVFSLFYTAEAQFVPGTNPVCPWDIPGTKGGRQSLCVKSLCAFFVP